MIVVIDTETTGFPKQAWARVIELGAVALDDNGSEIATFESLIREECPAEASKALEVNNISREAILAAPSREDVRAEWIEWLKPFKGQGKMTAFNVAFDRPMLRKSRMSPKDDRWGPCVMLAAMDVIKDMGALVRMGYRGWKWPKLEEAAAHFKVEVVGDAHRALTDARTAASVWKRIVESGKEL